MNNKFRFLCFLFFFFAHSSMGQALDFVKTFGGTSDDGIYDLETDKKGNIYATGWYKGAMDINPGPGVVSILSNGNRDGFVVKFDSLGNYIWSVHYGSTGQDEGSVITTDSSNNVIVAGRFSLTMTIAGGGNSRTLTAVDGRDIYLAKFDESGTLIWAYSFGGVGYDDAEEVATDADMNIYMAGSFNSVSIDFNPSPMATNILSSATLNDDGYLLKLDSSGVFQWVQQFATPGWDEVAGFKITDNSKLWLTGYFSGNMSIQPGFPAMQSAGSSDVMITCFDLNGVLLKQVSIGGSGIDYAFGIDVSSEKLYLSGAFSQVVDFDPGTGMQNKTSNGGVDEFMLALDTSFAFRWCYAGGGLNNDVGLPVNIINDNAVLFGGYYGGNATLNFNGSSKTYTGTDPNNLYFVICDSLGVAYRSFTYKSAGYENVHTCKALSNSKVILSGVYGGAVDFDPTSAVLSIGNVGATDCFVVQLSFECSNVVAEPVMSGSGSVCAGESLIYLVSDSISANYLWTYPPDWTMVTQSSSFVQVEAGFSGGNLVYHNYSLCSQFDSVAIPVSVHSITDSISLSVCDINPFITLSGDTIVEDTVLVQVINGTPGCDTLRTYFIDYFPSGLIDSLSFCEGDSITVGGMVYFVPGIYSDTTFIPGGCVQVHYWVINQNPISDEVFYQHICRGDSVIVGNSVYYDNGVYIDTLQSALGCDSIVTTHVIVQTSAPNYFSDTICQGQVYVVGLHSYSIPGVYIDTLSSVIGCDSVVVTQLFVNPVPVVNQSFAICFGDSVVVGNSVYFYSGNYIDTLAGPLICDTLIYTQIFMTQLDTSLIVSNNILVAAQSGVTYQWMSCNSGQFIPIPGAVGQIFVASMPGSYAVALDNGTCRDTSLCYNVLAIGLDEPADNLVSVLPNPISEYCTINCERGIIKIELYCSDGRMINSFNGIGSTFRMNTNSLIDGCYFIKVYTKAGMSMKRIVKL